MVKNITLVFIFIISQTALIGQSGEPINTNLDIFYGLVDSSTALLSQKLTGENYLITVNVPPDLNIFEGRIKGKLALESPLKEASGEVIYTLESAKVEYKDISRDGLFGDYQVNRTVSIRGYYIYGRGVNNFALTAEDIIKLDDTGKLEYTSLPFTHGEKPEEPFFSTLYQPAIILAALAVTTYLFFSVRSK
ncbi:MAG: hypothetical protein AB9882_08790 [Ignavibacteriaceae bacterium]